jgi:hypothetical protein
MNDIMRTALCWLQVQRERSKRSREEHASDMCRQGASLEGHHGQAAAYSPEAP